MDFEKLKLFRILKELVIIENQTPKSQIKWERNLNVNLNWAIIWQNLENPLLSNKIKVFQWRGIHNVLYLESIIIKFGNSDGKCHLCKSLLETNEHLFYDCQYVKYLLNFILTKLFTIFPEITSLRQPIDRKILIFGLSDEIENRILRNVINFILFSMKWYIWKYRNDIKFNKKKMSV